MRPLALDLNEIQGDVLIGLQKNAENFIFFLRLLTRRRLRAC